MADVTIPPVRPHLSTSSTEFGLPPSSVASNSATAHDEQPQPGSISHRFRRPSILAPKAGWLTDSRANSPLASSFTLSRRKTRQNAEDPDNDSMWTDSSGSSENPTPNGEDRGRSRLIPLTPPPRRAPSMDNAEDPPSGRFHMRRPSIPLKQPRILNLLAESRPEESEVKSEAAFQRLLADLPAHPRTPRTGTSDRGRYPEEAGHEDSQREDTPSDDERGEDTFSFYPPSASEPINITPANSTYGGDDCMSIVSASPGAMDVDMLSMYSGSPSMSTMPSLSQWRYTPPPTSSAVRSNKRKLDDRYDPYPNAKRRAVSPSMHQHLRERSIPRSTCGTPRGSISIPPGSNVSSAASSPTISSALALPNNVHTPRSTPQSVLLSPTMRGLASPVLRPVMRYSHYPRDEREVQGAGDGVGGLTLG